MSTGAVTRQAWVEQIMGMPISIHLRGATPDAERRAAVAEVYAELRHVDTVFSTYREDSDIRRLDRGEVALSECDPTVDEVLRLCEEAKAATGGYFDALLPATDGSPRLDPSGLVKGWATERAAARLAQLAGDDHYLNAGGDIALRCGSPLAPRWRIGLEDPDRPGAILGVLPLATGGIATSGTAQRGAHIVDPTTGAAATGLRAVTVTGPSLLWADVYATAAFARGVGALEWLADLDGYDALVVLPDGALKMTAGMRRLFQPAR